MLLIDNSPLLPDPIMPRVNRFHGDIIVISSPGPQVVDVDLGFLHLQVVFEKRVPEDVFLCHAI